MEKKMIITIKNLQQQTFTIDFETQKTVLELKNQINVERGPEYAVEKQKLIYAGVILEDERSIASYNIDEKKFVVVMLKREIGVTAQKPAEPQTSVTEQQSPQTSKQNDPVEDSSNPAQESGTSTERGNEIATENVSSNTGSVASHASLLMGDDYNKTINSIIEMGYTREMAARAMAASYNNPERAVEYLVSGIPEIEEAFAPTEEHITEGQSVGRQARTERMATIPQEDPFEFLRNQPQFLQMRSLVYQNPDLLHAVLQQIGQTNPALLQLISENQDAFLNMLNQPIDGHRNDNASENAGRRIQLANATRQMASEIGDGIANATPSEGQSEQNSDATRERRTATGPVATITLSAQDQLAIDRLKALGFPEALVLQAYFACDKDEQLAANFLISSAFDD